MTKNLLYLSFISLIFFGLIISIPACYKQVAKDFGNKETSNLQHQLEDTYAAIQILSDYHYMQEKIDTSIHVTKEDVIWAKSVLNSVGSQFGYTNVGSNLQPCY